MDRAMADGGTVVSITSEDPTATSLRGLIDRIDDGVARVFVGDNEDEWFFPSHLFPKTARAGDCVWLQRIDGRYTVVGSTPHRSNPDIRGFAERLNRLRADRRGVSALPSEAS
jgi:hypothetical protein